VTHMLSVTVAPHPLMRIEMLWPNTDWLVVRRNFQETPAPETFNL
jgi:hypothetical protein